MLYVTRKWQHKQVVQQRSRKRHHLARYYLIRKLIRRAVNGKEVVLTKCKPLLEPYRIRRNLPDTVTLQMFTDTRTLEALMKENEG